MFALPYVFLFAVIQPLETVEVYNTKLPSGCIINFNDPSSELIQSFVPKYSFNFK